MRYENPLCRCQVESAARFFTVAREAPALYAVRVRISFPQHGSGFAAGETIDAIVQSVRSGYLVADTECAGKPSTSLLTNPSLCANA
jgi:hypothetical protein